jgi:sodium/proline symporter
LFIGTLAAGGAAQVIKNAKEIPGFFEFFGIASPKVTDGVQEVVNGVPQYKEAGEYGLYTILSTLAWGLGYFGMPQVLLRFMAIRDSNELKTSRRIATVWVVISLAAAAAIGIIGRAVFPTALLTYSDSERIFIVLSSNLLPAFLAGFVMAGILAATISSSDSYLLIAASAFSKNIYQHLIKKDATDKEVMNVSRIILILICIIGIFIALDENSVIFTIVSFAWAGFGATFGPIIIFSLLWKRTTREGAIAGMLSGGIMVFVWKLVLRPLGGLFGVYELLPAFIVSCLFIYAVSKMTAEPSEEIQKEFETVMEM